MQDSKRLIELRKEENAVNKREWPRKLWIALILIIFSPLVIVGVVIAGIHSLFQLPKNKRAYINSRYYADFKQKFMTSILYSPEYRFYNSAIHRKLPIQYVKQETNGLEYFIYNETLFLFPDFKQIDLNEEGTTWQADYNGKWKNFEDSYARYLTKIDGTYDLPVKLLVERKMFPLSDLNGVDIPDCIYVTWSYEDAFENEESPQKMIIPQNSQALYDRMLQTPDLCGDFKLVQNNKIEWHLYENYKIELGVDPRECYLGIAKLLFGKIESSITHWHPTNFEIYNEVCRIGKRGNVLVLRSSWFGTTVLYSGSKEDCPYSPDQKHLIGDFYYLEAS